MEKMPKFMVCENKKAQSGKLYLLHTQKPMFIGEIVFYDNLKDLELKPPEVQVRIGSKIVALYVLEYYNEVENNRKVGLMDRVKDWLLNYFK